MVETFLDAREEHIKDTYNKKASEARADAERAEAEAVLARKAEAIAHLADSPSTDAHDEATPADRPRTPAGGGAAAAAALAATAREAVALTQAAAEAQAVADAAAAAALQAARPQHRSALVLGVGMSTAPMHLYEQGFKRVVCIDVSARVVTNLTERYKEFPGIEVMECDARNLDRFADGCFDLVLDKGLVDVLYSGWVGFKDVDLVNEAACRVLTTGGVFISVSHAPPSVRGQHFEESATPETNHRFHPWDCRVARGPEDSGDRGGCWVYAMSRLPPGESKERGDEKRQVEQARWLSC